MIKMKLKVYMKIICMFYIYYSEKLEDFYNKDRLNNIESKLLYKYLKKYQIKDMNSYFYKYHNEKMELYV